ncbi:MAG: hypothetical protein AAB270_00275, partial [Chloroflexota bacterium]
MKAAVRKQRGQVLPLALMVLGAGALMMGPLLGYVSTSLSGLRTTSTALEKDYAVDAGVEQAIWRLMYDSNFALTLVEEEPYTYPITVNGVSVQVVITRKNLLAGGSAPPPQSDRIRVAKTVMPAAAPRGVETLFTFTMQVQNVGTSRVHLG